MKISKIKIGILFIFVIFIIEGVSFASYQTSLQNNIKEREQRLEIEQIEADLNDEEQEVLNLINEYRKQNGLAELKPIFSLQQVSKIKAEDLVENNYVSHTSKKLGTPFEMLTNNNIDYKIAGENIAGNIAPKKAVEAWINSPTHRDNILEEKYEYTGICAINSEIYGKLYVQLFIGI